MKTCVFITGTNAVGKTSLAFGIIEAFGGIAEANKALTRCADGRVCFAGRYVYGRKFGGVDGLNATSGLRDVVRLGLETSEIIFCEGMYLHTFGLNLTNALFAAEKQLVCFLYAPASVISQRLKERSGTKIHTALRQQMACAASANKWASIGVPVLAINTGETKTADAVEIVKKALSLCGQ